MTTYRFFKTAAIESEIYFRVQVWGLHLFKEAEIFFAYQISIKISQSTELKLLPVLEMHGRHIEILLSVFILTHT